MGKHWKLRELSKEAADRLQPPLHLGALVPWANLAMEAELPFILPDSVVWHFSRLVPECRKTEIDEEFLQGMVQAIPQSLYALSCLPLSGIAFGCTSASFSYKDLVHDQQLHAVEPCFLSAFNAIVYMLKLLNVHSIALFTPYEQKITDREIHALSTQGITTVDVKSLGMRDDIGMVSESQIIDSFVNWPHREVEGVVMSCTALHTLNVIEHLEKKLGCPVISSNTAMGLALPILIADQTNRRNRSMS